MFKGEEEIPKKWLFLARKPRIHCNSADGYFMTESIKPISDLKSDCLCSVAFIYFTTLHMQRPLLVIKKKIIPHTIENNLLKLFIE